MIEEGQGAREIQIRIIRYQAGKPRNSLRNQDGSCLGMANLGRVFRVGEKRELAGAGVLDPGKAGDFQVSVAFEAAAQGGGDLTKSHVAGNEVPAYRRSARNDGRAVAWRRDDQKNA